MMDVFKSYPCLFYNIFKLLSEFVLRQYDKISNLKKDKKKQKIQNIATIATFVNVDKVYNFF